MASWSTSSTKSHSTTNTKETGKTWQESQSQQQSSSKEQSASQSTTKNILDEALLSTILGGLSGQMTQEEIAAFAESLLRPQLNAGIESAQQEFETAKLSKQQEIENLAAQLARSIEQQNMSYRQSMADVETAALARGMGRSSYTLESMAKQGDALARAVMQLTDENTRRSEQIQQQITQAAQQNAQTQGRLNTDYASQLAAKIQELTQQQRQEYNSNYLSAISAAMGKQTTGSSESIGSSSMTGSTTTQGTSENTGYSETNSTSTTTSSSGSTKSGGGSSSKSNASYTTYGGGTGVNKSHKELLH